MNFMLLTSEIVDNLNNVESGLESLSDSFNHIWEIFIALAGIIGIGVSGFTAVTGFIIAIVTSIVSFLIVFFTWLLPAIALFRMGRKAGYKHCWLAFIPFAQTYFEFVLPRRKFNVGFIKTYKRDVMAFIFLGLTFFGTTIVGLLNAAVGFGQILDLLFFVFMQILTWRKMYDVIRSVNDKELALIVSIISLFVPIVYPIALLFNMNRAPEYGVGNYYNVPMKNEEGELLV